MLKTNDVGETLPEGMSAACDHAGHLWSERDGAAAAALVRARDSQWRAEVVSLIAEVRSLRADLETATREHAETRAQLALARKDCNAACGLADRRMVLLEEAGAAQTKMKARIRDLEADLDAERAYRRDRL